MNTKLKPGAAAPSYPRLSDRKAAQFLRLKASQQLRLLKDYKYPKNTPQVFMQPYYQMGHFGIREVIRRGFPGLIDARAKVQAIGRPTVRGHNARLLESFATSPFAARKLTIVPTHRYQAHIRNVELRLSPHVVALDEEGVVRYLYFNEKAKKLDPEEARLTLEFASWILSENEVEVQPHQLEVIDLFTGILYTGREPRAETLWTLEEMARLIEGQWETI